MPPVSGTEGPARAGQSLGTERAEWAGDAAAEAERQCLGQRLESIGQRASMPSQRLESLAGSAASHNPQLISEHIGLPSLACT